MTGAAEPGGPRLPVHYLLPLRWKDDKGIDDLADYLGSLVPHVDVILVDGSDAERRAEHRAALPAGITVLDCDRRACRNGKVAGVLAALPTLWRPLTIIADDDVRYDPADLHRVVELLDGADLVIPQNHFRPADHRRLPWHADWDTARTLINRALGSDFPGTLALRTEMLAGGYDGDVLFENLELIRTVRARGGTVRSARDLFVARRPPATTGFIDQRIRQAYDSWAQPARFLAELSVLPLAATLLRRPVPAVAATLLVIAVAEAGRRRASGTEVFSPTASLWAPLWVGERAICAWIALWLGLRGGVKYHGTRLRLAAHSQRRLDREWRR
ncbi:glycosyl transferase family 2 [Brevibacterium sanguinis]|uniref:Glycosyl transferase family 2 n=2 Tax=Brevibacterium TaxID=1696 RepID=A0A366IM21_9MICO|nr:MULTISPECIES: glycosyltransferase [Brevibacterium]RBP65452.1 glycosyl transferase family 2 [Brevibacterium sanguinis]RBP72086.1 glycosyl transferase family 2 [Brevibacterium celere]